MSKTTRTRSKTRLSRALGIPLTPKAAKYLEKRPYAPGEHGRTKKKADSDVTVAQYGCGWTMVNLFAVQPPPADIAEGHENITVTVRARI